MLPNQDRRPRVEDARNQAGTNPNFGGVEFPRRRSLGAESVRGVGDLENQSERRKHQAPTRSETLREDVMAFMWTLSGPLLPSRMPGHLRASRFGNHREWQDQGDMVCRSGSGTGDLPDCVASVALKATLEKSPTGRWIIGSNDVATITEPHATSDRA
jgi:hypothetical protein